MYKNINFKARASFSLLILFVLLFSACEKQEILEPQEQVEQNLLERSITRSQSMAANDWPGYNNSQCDIPTLPCLPDCPADVFFTPYLIYDAIITPTCVLRITYSYRIACGTWYDYYLAGVELIGGGCTFDTNDPKAVVEQAMLALLNANPAHFPPSQPAPNQGPNCEINWRAGLGPCWSENEGCYLPCDYPSTCSLTAYEVCIDDQGVITVVEIGTIGGDPGPCILPCVKVFPLGDLGGGE